MKGINPSHPYIPNSVPEIKRQMMEEIGIDHIMQLYDEIPENLKFKGKMNLPEPIRDEYSIKRHTEAILARNKNCAEYISFLGAGCAQHFVPAVCDEMAGRGEFLTAYGAETWADHGKHQVFFEYQSMMAELLDMDFLTVPCYDGAPATADYKVITLMPDENGYPDLEAMKSALSSRTAAIFVTNPEDTGIFNPRIREYVDAAHNAGALCYYDQANVNGIMGITRARESGFDLIHYNLHKTFSSPHGGMGPGCGALGVRAGLEKFLPIPRVRFNGKEYCLDYNYPESIGWVRSFMGNLPILIRVYMWIMQMGEAGIREAAICSVLNRQIKPRKKLQTRAMI